MEDIKKITFGCYFSVYLGVFSFGSLVLPKLTALLVIGLAVFVIVGYRKKQLSWKTNIPALFLIGLYLAYLIGIFFANDLANGLKYAEYKSALFVIPILLSFKPNVEIRFQWSLIGLLIGTVVVAGIGIVSSCNCYDRNHWLLYCFSSSYISPVHHPSYFSGFLLFAAVGAWHGYRRKWKGFSLFTVIPYTLFALIFYFFCLSLAAMLFLGMVLIGLFVYFLYKKWGKWLAISVVVIGPFLLFLLLNILPGIKDDVQVTTKGLSEYVSNPYAFLMKRVSDTEIPGNQKRLVMWTVTSELIAEHPFGVGTGNVDEYLHARLKRVGFNQLVADDLNPHNQYLQTMLEIGIIGLLLLLGVIGSCMVIAYKKRNFLLFLLISGLAFNMLFESMFQRQSGVVFYAFWICLTLLYALNAPSKYNK